MSRLCIESPRSYPGRPVRQAASLMQGRAGGKRKKGIIFSSGEVFFRLTRPLMGDPITDITSFYHARVKSRPDPITSPCNTKAFFSGLFNDDQDIQLLFSL